MTFSDGSPFEAEDAAFSIDRTVNSELGCNVEGYVFGDANLVVNAVDPMTLTVQSPEPDPILPLRLSFVEMVPRTASYTERVREPIGTGPFAIERWDYGQKLSLVRNETYWGPKPEYARAEYQWRSEGSVRASMVTNGEAEIATSVGPEDGAGDLGVAYPNNETTALRIQAAQPPLDDMRVRQAIDRPPDRRCRRGIGEQQQCGSGESVRERTQGCSEAIRSERTVQPEVAHHRLVAVRLVPPCAQECRVHVTSMRVRLRDHGPDRTPPCRTGPDKSATPDAIGRTSPSDASLSERCETSHTDNDGDRSSARGRTPSARRTRCR